ncbi:hypothetical protein BDQ12DRAFT_680913 [Crucibulum laeve]|uniref:Uncharacterized protein n=1 Tax=Crucibulum laeve TaxID=68775 RepID=A0A5C3M528_9AGAR|nr:hypothetical protein BDQ12DRAFT_680913 [Crucibulum laeve]
MESSLERIHEIRTGMVHISTAPGVPVKTVIIIAIAGTVAFFLGLHMVLRLWRSLSKRIPKPPHPGNTTTPRP